MDQLFRFSSAVLRDPAVEAWFAEHQGELGAIARVWFQVMRNCGDDVCELLHDGCPTACVQDAAFCYVNVFKAHVNVGFYCGAELDDVHSILIGAGKRMRHVKLMPDQDVNESALRELIQAAYRDMKIRLTDT